jgi:hypothetical protein
MPFPANTDEKTKEAFTDPQVGDRFTEMYSFWMYIIGRRGNKVITMEGSPPITFPEGATMHTYTLEEFNTRFSYGSIDGYWVTLVDRGNNVEGWIEEGLYK